MAKWKRDLSLQKRWTRNHLVNKYNNTCHICDEQFDSMKDITIDHFVPLSKGGEQQINNYRLAHWHCNQLKADLLPEEFDEFQKKMLLI